MKIPQKVKIGGHYYAVKHVENLNDPNDHCGFCKLVANEILINKNGQAQSQQEETLIHEIMEAINYNYELKLEHRQITIIASAFYQVLKDNKFI